MVDIDYLKKIRLVSNPIGQQIIAAALLMPNYNLLATVDIQVENVERIPRDENVIFAMNHTDRFNYWPLQYKLWRLKFPFSTVWVKGKYYRNALLAKGLDLCNLIPVPSMGYLIEEFYKKKFNRRIDREEYRKVRDAIDGKEEGSESYRMNLAHTIQLFGENFVEFMNDYYERVMASVAQLSCVALFEKHINIIIFPEGTRGTQLGEGRTGLAQLALYTGKKIVPVACNNSDQVYPGTSPVAKSGRIIYRIGAPLSVDHQLKEFRIEEKFELLSRESQLKYKSQFEGVTRVVMESINAMLDERYRRAFSES